MKYFNKAYDFIREREGGYANVANDKGGETYAGVSRVNFPSEPIWYWIDQLKLLGPIKHNSIIPSVEPLVREFYARLFKHYRIPEIKNESTAIAIFDYIVHSGTTAVKRIQRLVGVKDDGAIGPQTLGAINSANQAFLQEDILKDRKALFEQIVARDPSQAKFLTGWINRLNELAAVIKSPVTISVSVALLLLTLIVLLT